MNLPESIYESVLILIELGILLGSVGVVLSANIVYSASSSGLVFICISLPYLVPNADSVAAAQSPIYVGAINVSIVSAVTVIDEPVDSNSTISWNMGDTIALGACTGLSILSTTTIRDTKWSDINPIDPSRDVVGGVSKNNIQRIGYQLLTQFLVPFELLSILLLVASVGAITMARGEGITRPDEEPASSSGDDSPSF
uniref:NAD(P)H-quinone oxidoreductase subunit 6, chloroplastic n=1 Tax=Dipteris conjugata TaxID=32108 RepID=A0A0B5ED72_9MONI|nr:NADH-plastoquinone oxidoreductase subunit 6 [Dipteris conjugata]AXX76455.1 NADH-plastoquinone oxidoreductase subunit 6 [Dipteris conjugata]